MFILVLSLLLFVHYSFALDAVKIRRINDHSNQELLPTECGIGRSILGRITNGKKALTGQFPWMARLGSTRVKGDKNVTKQEPKFFCGGTIINKKYIVTATHCLVDDKMKVDIIRVGDDTFTDPEERPQFSARKLDRDYEDYDVDEIIMHSNFSRRTGKNDIALIRVKDSIEFTNLIHPVCLPKGKLLKQDFATHMSTVAGWGIVDSDTNTYAQELLYVDIPIRDRCACEKIYDDKTVDESQWCAGVFTGEDSCKGDSGGPLMKKILNSDGEVTYLVGVVSFGLSYCGESPAIYTNILYFLDWILDKMH